MEVYSKPSLVTLGHFTALKTSCMISNMCDKGWKKEYLEIKFFK